MGGVDPQRQLSNGLVSEFSLKDGCLDLDKYQVQSSDFFFFFGFGS